MAHTLDGPSELAARAATPHAANRYRRDPDQLQALLAAAAAGTPRPILLSGGAVLTMNPTLGDWARADVLIGGRTVVGVGPGLMTAAEDDGMVVVDCAGTVVLPSTVNFASPADAGTLTPGAAADIAVVRVADAPDTPGGPAVARGLHLDVLLRAGRVIVWGGEAVGDEAPSYASLPLEAVGDSSPRFGTWADGRDFLRQHLLPGGRYDEARGERESAYRGRYWIAGDRIDYLDDLGFWAYGEFRGPDTLDHAGYHLTRRAA